MMYLIPRTGDLDSLIEMVKRARGVFISPVTIRDLILEESSSKSNVVVVAISAEQLSILTRYPAELLDDVPFAVHAIPGAVYDANWSNAATALPPLDYLELEKMLSKSGHTSFTVDQLEKKHTGFAGADLYQEGDTKRGPMNTATTEEEKSSHEQLADLLSDVGDA